MQIEQYEIDEINAEREAILAEQEAEQEYDSDLFADTWNAEPFDGTELILPDNADEMPEWLFGGY